MRIIPTRYVAVEKLTGEVLGANILRLNLEPLRQTILADPRVLGVVTRVDFFHLRVHVEVRERAPLVAVGLRSGEKMWVDREGVILEPADEAWAVGVKAEGNRVEPEVVEAVLAWAQLPRALRERYPVLDFSQDQAVAPGSPTILFGAICQVPKKLGILTTLWREGLLEGFGVVDLRANDVVILKRGG
ncbi:MAG: hypothetical protein NZ651_01815 [Candidatus Bipolaricaulota bacterium]|nr:hypothetical protein [Candidatus Bipolaricaulota bacterium]MDW8126496.1 hypothetical protein [Candidatus Bipolaricaulota bacterium]